MSDPVTPRTYALLREFVGTSAALIVVSFGLLSARVLQRFSQRIKFKIDDWLLNAAWVSLTLATNHSDMARMC